VEAAYAAAAPPPDPNVANEVSQQAQAATQAESEVLDQAQAAPLAATGAPTSVTLGMTIDQVIGVLGQPQVVGDLGSKKTYFYGNMKVIFTDGKVTDIQ
jgi:outer membrane protein assembly factor BamE (lipoprotein component of BamABCDE complex)